ncbi:VOC family protein [Glycomyces endophyticus]
MDEMLSPRAFQEADASGQWRVLGDGACAHFRTGSMREAAEFAAAVADLPGVKPHRPDLDLRSEGVTVRLVAVEPGLWGLTAAEVALAQDVSAVAAGLGLESDPSRLQSVQVAVDALSHPEVIRFWKAVLGYEERGEEDLADPMSRNAAFWFQEMDEPRPQRNRLHVDVFLPHDRVEARLAAALAAGGTLVRDRSPHWWVVADPEGNEACVSTLGTRGSGD